MAIYPGRQAAVGRSELWTAALIYGQAQATPAEAAKIVSKLGLKKDRKVFESYLTDFPNKGLGPVVPTDRSSTRSSATG